MKSLVSLVATSLALGATSAFATITPRDSVPAVSVKGNAFFAGSNRFYVRGVDYQPGMPIVQANEASGCLTIMSHRRIITPERPHRR